MATTGAAALSWLAGLALSAVACGGGATSSDAGGAGGGNDGGAGSDGGDGGFCSAFFACGGDVVGTWRVDPLCVPAMKVQSGGCQDEEFDLTQIVSDATWTFRADLTMTLTLTAAGAATVRAPAACLVSGGAPVACADAGAMLSGRIAIVGSKATTATCQSAGTVCTCAIPFVAAPVQGTGTYSTAGTTLTFTLGASTLTADYCASPSVFKERTTDALGQVHVGVYDKQ
jgi:hypothetical protein